MIGQLFEAGEVLADRDVGTEQDGVDRSRAGSCVVDIVAVDSDEDRAVFN